MAALLKFLLDPRVLIAIALAGLLFYLYSANKTYEVEVASLKGEKAELIQKNEDLGRQIVNLGFMVNQLKENLIAAKQSIKDMQKIKEEANDLRRKLIALQNQPTSCEELKVQYETVAIDITNMFNNRLRRKIDRTSSAGYYSTAKVLSDPTPTSID